jgi:hypothetical protein
VRPMIHLSRKATIHAASAIIAGFVIGGLALVVISVWPGTTSPKTYCGWVPRGKFSSSELRRLDSASGSQRLTYHTCILVIYSEIGIGFPADNAIVRLPVDLTAQQVAVRTGWKMATNRCPLGEQDIRQTFGGGHELRWTAFTWNGEPAVCNVGFPEQLPDVVLLDAHTAYDLFTDSQDDLSGYFLDHS